MAFGSIGIDAPFVAETDDSWRRLIFDLAGATMARMRYVVTGGTGVIGRLAGLCPRRCCRGVGPGPAGGAGGGWGGGGRRGAGFPPAGGAKPRGPPTFFASPPGARGCPALPPWGRP